MKRDFSLNQGGQNIGNGHQYPFSDKEIPKVYEFFENMVHNATLSTGLYIVSNEGNVIRASTHPITYDHKIEKFMERVIHSFLTLLSRVSFKCIQKECIGYDDNSTKSPISSSASSTSTNASTSSSLTSSSGDTAISNASSLNITNDSIKKRKKYIFELEINFWQTRSILIITRLEKANFDEIEVGKLKTMKSNGAEAYNCYFDLSRYIMHGQQQVDHQVDQVQENDFQNKVPDDTTGGHSLIIKPEEEDSLIQNLNRHIFGHYSLKCFTVRDKNLKIKARKIARQNVKYVKYFGVALAVGATAGVAAFAIHRFDLFAGSKFRTKEI